MRVPEGNDTEPSKHRDTRVRALALLHKITYSREDILLIDTELARLVQVVREDVEEQLRVGRRVDVPVSGLVHKLEEFGRVDEVPVLVRVSHVFTFHEKGGSVHERRRFRRGSSRRMAELLRDWSYLRLGNVLCKSRVKSTTNEKKWCSVP